MKGTGKSARIQDCLERYWGINCLKYGGEDDIGTRWYLLRAGETTRKR